jgi:hypothetical protein
VIEPGRRAPAGPGLAAALAAAGAAGAHRPGLGRCCCAGRRAGAPWRCATWRCACPSWRRRARRLVREHFGWLGRSLLERGLLWYASPARLKRLIHVEGDVHLAERSGRPVMWLVPHFMALDVAGAATQLFQKRRWARSTTPQSNPVLDAAMRAAAALRAARSSRATTAPCRWCAPSSAARLLQPARHGLRPARRRLRALLRRAGGHAAGALAHGALAGHDGAAGGGRDAARRPGLPRALPAEPWSDWPTDDPRPTPRA